jgi:amino acid transporter
VTVGELWAFIIGWNLILEYVIGTAAIARAFTPYFDSLTSNNTVSAFFLEHVPLHVETFSSYADLIALGITLILTVVLCLGVKESSLLNNIFTVVNLVIVAYVMIVGLFKANIHYWNIPYDEVPDHKNNGDGGFFPYGVSGMLAGSATCFYAFVGFDVIATTGEEVINPQKAIPISIILSLLICGIAYVGLAGVLTLMVPYYSLDKTAPLPKAFSAVGWPIANSIIAVGALCSFATCLLTTMFPMPRIIFAMSRDGLLFRFLARINHRFKTPLNATIVSGLLAGLMTTLFDLGELVAMMSIGTLLAYTLVAACVLILRYEYNPNGSYGSIQYEESRCGCNILCPPRGSLPTQATSRFVKISVLLIAVLTMTLGLIEIYLIDQISQGVWWSILLLVLPIVAIVFFVILIARQPQQTTLLAFRVPLVPFLPTLSIIMNIYLMLKLSKNTWIRFAVWMGVGLVIYFGYGMHHAGDQTTIAEPNPTGLDTTLTEPLEPSEAEGETKPLLASKPVHC